MRFAKNANVLLSINFWFAASKAGPTHPWAFPRFFQLIKLKIEAVMVLCFSKNNSCA